MLQIISRLLFLEVRLGILLVRVTSIVLLSGAFFALAADLPSCVARQGTGSLLCGRRRRAGDSVRHA